MNVELNKAHIRKKLAKDSIGIWKFENKLFRLKIIRIEATRANTTITANFGILKGSYDKNGEINKVPRIKIQDSRDWYKLEFFNTN